MVSDVVTPVAVVVSEPDPVAPLVAERWGTLPSTGEFVDGAAVRRLTPDAVVIRRPGRHIEDEGVDARLPPELRAHHPTLVFPSVHRSEQNVHCLTVHPLGNLGPETELGGRARTVVPTDPARMASTVRRLAEEGKALGLPATYEATHHGPALDLPAFFVEVGYGTDAGPSNGAVGALARCIREMEASSGDRVAMAVGGGHYAPHFTDLVLRRRWAVGQIVSRHALGLIERATAEAAYRATPGAEGILYARAADADHPALAGLGPRLRDNEAPVRAGAENGVTPGGRSTSGT